jgi:death-on-curing protein
MIIRFLTLEEVVNIHRAQIVAFGGLHGIRDIGLLESAVNTSQASFGGELLHEDVPSQAAAYLYHIVKNHPFLDGNKRTGVLSAMVFLEANDITTPWSNDELFELAMHVATSKISKDNLIEKFRSKLLT